MPSALDVLLPPRANDDDHGRRLALAGLVTLWLSVRDTTATRRAAPS